MINIEDYKAYLYQNHNFIELLKENNSLIYDRLEDVFKVLNFIELMVDASKPLEEELEIIFEVGFSYLHEQIEEIKVYYHRVFNNNYSLMQKYESLINYSLYLSDLEEVLKEKNLYNEQTGNTINSVIEKIEKTIMDQQNFEEDIYDHFNHMLEQNINANVLTTLQIYGLIVEELAI